MLSYEKECLGLYVTKNPLSEHADTISVYSTANTSQLKEETSGNRLIIGGMIQKFEVSLPATADKRRGENGGVYAGGFTEPANCDVVGLLCSVRRCWRSIKFCLSRQNRPDKKTPQIICEELIDIGQAAAKLAVNTKVISCSMKWRRQKKKIASLKSICSAHRGKSPVYITVKTITG